MESVSYPTSGALNRAHYALVSKIENASSSSEVESLILGVINETRHRILSGSGSGFGRLEDLARNWGVHLPTATAWDPVSEQYSAIPANISGLFIPYLTSLGVIRKKRERTSYFSSTARLRVVARESIPNNSSLRFHMLLRWQRAAKLWLSAVQVSPSLSFIARTSEA